MACSSQKEIVTWSKEDAKNQLSDRENPLTWDTAMFNRDLKTLVAEANLPLPDGVYPVPDYNRPAANSFKGVGNFGYPGGTDAELHIDGKTILYNSFFAGANKWNNASLKNKKNEIFFQIILVTDTVDTINYSHTGSEIISRNHPHYIGQGFYRTKNQKIEYVAFQTADRQSYAIVNMRLFDLSLGKTILIAPQTDESLRSMQINSPNLSSEEIELYTDSLISLPPIRQFFTQNGTI
jgi:hypothetical protein